MKSILALLFRLDWFNLWVKMILRLIRAGQWRLYAVCNARGDCDLLDFLQSDASDDLAPAKAAMLTTLDRIAHTFEQPRQSEKSHIVDRRERIWQLTESGIRVLWFYDNEQRRAMIFSHGFKKTTRTTPASELQRARRVLKAYLNARQAGAISTLEGS